MNNFHLVTEFIKDWFSNHKSVNTVTHGATPVTDTQKKNIFPLTHFNVISAPVVTGDDLFTFEIAMLDLRTAPDEVIVDKFYRTDNELDNLNLCHAILSQFCTYLTTQNNDQDISYTTLSDMTPIFYAFGNGLDGWAITVTLSIPKNKVSAC